MQCAFDRNIKMCGNADNDSGNNILQNLYKMWTPTSCMTQVIKLYYDLTVVQDVKNPERLSVMYKHNSFLVLTSLRFLWQSSA